MHGGHMPATDSQTALRILWDGNVGLSTRYSCYPHTAVARLEGGSFAAQAKALHLGQPPQYAGTPVRSTGIGIPAPGMQGRQLAATDSPNAARHSWGPYASPSTWYWYTRVLQWRLVRSGRQEGSLRTTGGSCRRHGYRCMLLAVEVHAPNPTSETPCPCSPAAPSSAPSPPPFPPPRWCGARMPRPWTTSPPIRALSTRSARRGCRRSSGARARRRP